VDKSICNVKNFQRDWIQYAGRCCRDRGTCHVGSVRVVQTDVMEGASDSTARAQSCLQM
jgi:hypothetical protein